MAAEEYGWLFCVDCEHSEFVGPDIADMGIDCTNCGSERNFANTLHGFYLDFLQLISDWCNHAHAKTGVHKSPEFDLHLTRVRDAVISSDNIIPNQFSELQKSLEPLIDGVYAESSTVDEVDVEFMVRIKRMMPTNVELGPSQVYPYPLGHQLCSDNPMRQVTSVLKKYLLANGKQ
jgi:DNA-directed RNA polymerase subunit RPC12/RpoP